jgi:hypothetical protein
LTRIWSQPSQQAVQGWHSRWAGGLAKVFPGVIAVKPTPRILLAWRTADRRKRALMETVPDESRTARRFQAAT